MTVDIAESRRAALVLYGGTVIDATGRDPIADGVVLIRDGRIVAVGTAAQVTVPAGVTRVDAKGQYVINKSPVEFASVEQLAGELRRAGAGLREPIVIISADAAATHQSVIRVMEASRVAGLSQITFTTQSAK